MKQTPYYKGPGCAVPKTTEKHDDDQICPSADGTHLISAQRNIKVIAQECRKRDMPTPPEIGKSNSRVWEPEIVFQMKTQAQRGADSASGVTREIKKYLAGECHYTQPGIYGDKWPGIAEDAIGRTGKHHIGKHDLFE